MKPLVSIIVPIHNDDLFLRECIMSILRQSYKNIELLLIDDCSSDQSPEICKSYYKKDGRIKLIELPSNMGVSAARNMGIEHSSGRFICFVDADDFLDDNYIEYYVDSIIKHKVQVVFGMLMYYQDGAYLRRRARINDGIHYVKNIEPILIDDGSLTGILFGSVCAAIYNADYLRANGIRFNESLKKNEDGLFNIDIILRCDMIYVTHYAGYYYRQWKKAIDLPPFEVEEGIELASNELCKKYSGIIDFKKQMCRRIVSVAFQNAITVGQRKGSMLNNCRRLEKYLEDIHVNSYYSTLEFKRINIYKRILIMLLYRRWIFLFYFILKYIYPVMKRFR